MQKEWYFVKLIENDNDGEQLGVQHPDSGIYEQEWSLHRSPHSSGSSSSSSNREPSSNGSEPQFSWFQAQTSAICSFNSQPGDEYKTTGKKLSDSFLSALNLPKIIWTIYKLLLNGLFTKWNQCSQKICQLQFATIHGVCVTLNLIAYFSKSLAAIMLKLICIIYKCLAIWLS